MQFTNILALVALASFTSATFTDRQGRVTVRSLTDEDVKSIARAVSAEHKASVPRYAADGWIVVPQ